MPLSISIGALPDQRFEGVLNFISPSGVENNGIVEFEIKADVNLKDDVFLRANYSANAEVILSEAKNVLTLESAHIRYDDNGDAYVEVRSEEHTSELQSRGHLVCRLLLEIKM